MATQLRSFAVTIPKGTPKATPALTAMNLQMRKVERIDWRVPPGPSGKMGWALFMGGTQVIPQAPDPFIVANDEHDTWVLDDLPDEGEWQLAGYNTGIKDHTVYLRFHVSALPAASARPALTLIPGDLLSG